MRRNQQRYKNFRKFLGRLVQLPDKPAEHVIVGVDVQYWDIENLLDVHRLRDTQHRRGHLDVGEFLDDRLHLLVQNIDDLTQRLRHWAVEGLHHGHVVLAVLAASVLFQPSLRPHLSKRWRPCTVELILVQLEELSSPGNIDSELAPWSVVRGRLWQSSVLVRSGALLLPQPLRRSSARGEATDGAVAVSSAVRSQQLRVQRESTT